MTLSIPTLHAATVHFPIAFLLASSAAGLLYLAHAPIPHRATLRRLTWWSMVAGWVATGVAVLSGLLAQAGLPPQAAYRGVLNWHIGTGLGLLVVYGALLYARWLRRPGRAATRSRHHPLDVHANAPDHVDLLDAADARWWVVGLLVAGALLVIASGWNGGRLVYEWGVNVAK